MIIYNLEKSGNPKGVVHTHGSLEAMMKTMEDSWGWNQDDHIANVIPLHHVRGIMNVMNTSLWAGARCTLIPNYDERKVWDVLLDDYDGLDLTVFMGVPKLYEDLLKHYDEELCQDRAKEIRNKLKKFRIMISGSSALSEETFNRWHEISGNKVLERYGSNEVGMALTNSYQDQSKRIPGYVGHPFPGVRARLLDHETGTLHKRPEHEGELLI